MRARIILAVTVMLGASVLGPASGQAQGTPNADSIVKSLTPTDNGGGGTRGIRLGNAPTGQAAGGQQRAGQGQAQEQAASKPASVSLNIQFATGSDALTPQAVRALDQLGRALATPTLAAYHFRIEGHTDTVGSPDLNKSLSERRAAAVVTYLTSKYQIDPARLQAVGMGEDGLLVSTPDNTPEARNRRVLVVNVGS
jgi:OOP family OmpA-OmpF porin